MSRADFISLLAHAVRDKAVTEDLAARLLVMFDAGELEVEESALPLPDEEAIRPADASDIERAMLALLAIGALSLLHRRVRQVRETLQDSFQMRAAALAKRYAAGGSLREWQGAMREAVVDNIIQQRAVGSGRVPTVAQISAITSEQSAYAARFAEEVALKALADEAPSYFQMAARSALYAGAGRAEGYRAEAELYPEGGAVTYTAVDDDGTCQPCLEAEGTYSVSEPFPTPGDVCNGYGNCRCTLSFSGVAA